MQDDAFNQEGFNEETNSTIDELMYLRTTFFSTFEGKQTFKWLLHNLKLIRPITNESDAALQQFAIKMLAVMGLIDLDSTDALFDYYSDIAAKDALDPRKINDLRRKLNVGQSKR